jgi:hypothetical protein
MWLHSSQMARLLMYFLRDGWTFIQRIVLRMLCLYQLRRQDFWRHGYDGTSVSGTQVNSYLITILYQIGGRLSSHDLIE